MKERGSQLKTVPIIGKVVLLNFYQAVIRKLFLYSVLDDIILEVSSQRVALK